MNDKPWVSFCIITYNQERFVRDAVEGALQQTYQPLEIVISDDASPDRTYEIVQEIVAAYRGPHRVVARRNERNLGLTANVNAVVEASHGELILLAGGDDISLPERTAKTVARWMEEGCPRGSLCTGYREINADGDLQPVIPPPLPPSPVDLSEWVRNPCPIVFGATHAFHRDLFREFGPLQSGRSCEDAPLGMRALALDGVFFLDDALVCYRRHAANLNGFLDDPSCLDQVIRAQARRLRTCADILSQVLADIDHPAFVRKWGQRNVVRAKKSLLHVLREKVVMYEWMAGGDSGIAWRTIRKAWRWPPMVGVGCRLFLRFLFPVLQRLLYEQQKARWRQRYKNAGSPI